MDKTFIFDLDDTLIPTKEHYLRAQKIFVDFVLNSLDIKDIPYDYINSRHDMMQRTLIKKQGFDTECFAESFRLAYLDLAEEFELVNHHSSFEAGVAYRIGKSVFDESRWIEAGLLPGAFETLDFLANKKDVDLKMATIGSDEMQRRKIRVLGLDQWFEKENIYVSLFGKNDIVGNISRDRNPEDVYFVGNSWKSDMIPALDAGIRGIYISDGDEGWAYNGSPDDRISKITSLENIIQLKNEYDNIVNSNLTQLQ
jgi:putative hydrolase of the HAD superfamily